MLFCHFDILSSNDSRFDLPLKKASEINGCCPAHSRPVGGSSASSAPLSPPPKTLISQNNIFFSEEDHDKAALFLIYPTPRYRNPTMYARTNTGSTHGDFQDRNGVNYVTSTESFAHCSQLFWKKDPNDSGVRNPAATAVS